MIEARRVELPQREAVRVGEVYDGRVEGRLWGPLHVYALRYVRDGVEVVVDDADIEWSPGALLEHQLHFRRVTATRVDVRVAMPPLPVPARSHQQTRACTQPSCSGRAWPPRQSC